MDDDTDSDNLSVDSDNLEDEEDYRMAIIFNAIRTATRHECRLWRGRLCPKLRELWLEMIEGSDPTDDVWLWMDGDEQWLREKFSRLQVAGGSFTKADHEGDWVDAQSALHRRIHRPCNKNAGQLAERIRNATPKQRVAAICWLTWNSSRVKALAIELGHTPWGMFGPGEIVQDLRLEVQTIRNLWKAFPENTAGWKEAEKKVQEDGCTCSNPSTEELLRCWFNMLTWLNGKPPTLEVTGDGSCTRCQSWCVLRIQLRVSF